MKGDVMKRLTTVVVVLGCLAASPVMTLAAGKPAKAQAKGERGTRDEAVAMVKKAAAYLQANGKEKAFAAFSDPKGEFVDRDLYVTVYDLNGTCLAHGLSPKLVGKNMIDMKDVDGKPFVKERNDKAKTESAFWIQYKYVNPISHGIEPKAMYTEKVGDVLICCGVYEK